MSIRAQTLISTTVSILAQMLVSHFYCLKSSSNSHFAPPLHRFECIRLSPTFNVSIRAQTLISHLHSIHLGPNTHLPPLLSQVERKRSLPATIVSLRAQSLVSCHLHHVNSSPTACLPPPPCQFELERSSHASTMSIRAQLLVCHPHHVNSSTTAHVPPPHQFKCNRSCAPSAVILLACRYMTFCKVAMKITLFTTQLPEYLQVKGEDKKMNWKFFM